MCLAAGRCPTWGRPAGLRVHPALRFGLVALRPLPPAGVRPRRAGCYAELDPSCVESGPAAPPKPATVACGSGPSALGAAPLEFATVKRAASLRPPLVPALPFEREGKQEREETEKNGERTKSP
jgi:hypothetical protein